jgi:thiol-disulfide isomerase/thioredoxin
MDPLTLLIILLVIASAYGFWYQRSRGKIKTVASNSQLITSAKIGAELGDKATLLQFSSAFCTPCRATRTLLSQVITDYPGINYIEVDAESNLELVRELNIKSTPTTLVLDANGAELSRAIGAPKRSDVINTINAIR